jgi:hypothetical protein
MEKLPMHNANEETYEQIKAERDAYRAELSAVMPADYKDWWQNSKLEWPLVASLTITSLRESIGSLTEALSLAAAIRCAQREQLIAMWAGSARSGRWLFDGEACSADTEGAEWEPYTEEEQATWLRDGVVPLLESLLFTNENGEVCVPDDLLTEHGFNEEPEDDTTYPRKDES